MIVSTNQPYFLPFLGFFHKAYLSDVLVILDGVQFPRRTTWISRNRFKDSQGTLWMTVPVWKKGLGLQKINDVRICYDFRWTRKHLASLKVAYANAPYFSDHLGFVEELFSSRFERLTDLNLKIIRYLLNELQIRTEVVLLSELGVEAKGELLPIEICRKIGSTRFLTQDSARKYLDLDLFSQAGIQLEHFKVKSPVYPQLWGDFIPDLSTFDLVFNCGPKARDILIL
ncbi:MAG: WbqC family protein [Syntrophobacteraceae bacterium]